MSLEGKQTEKKQQTDIFSLRFSDLPPPLQRHQAYEPLGWAWRESKQKKIKTKTEKTANRYFHCGFPTCHLHSRSNIGSNWFGVKAQRTEIKMNIKVFWSATPLHSIVIKHTDKVRTTMQKHFPLRDIHLDIGCSLNQSDCSIFCPWLVFSLLCQQQCWTLPATLFPRLPLWLPLNLGRASSLGTGRPSCRQEWNSCDGSCWRSLLGCSATRTITWRSLLYDLVALLS